MDQSKRFELKKIGDEGVGISRSEHPIEKAKIGADILNFLYGKLPVESGIIKSSDFTLRFTRPDEETVSIIMYVYDSNNTVDFKLRGKDAKKFIELVEAAQL